MEILQEYAAALELYKAKNFDAALKILDEVKVAAPHWKKSFLLEAYIRREQGESVKEFFVLKELLPRFDLSLPYEKSLAAVAWSLFGAVNQTLGLTAEAVKSFCLSAELEADNEKSCAEIGNALFAANGLENFSADDFKNLYSEYKKYLAGIEPYPKKTYTHDKIRVGFVSADFHKHPVMNWSLPLITGLDKNIFETYCYSAGKIFDDVSKFICAEINVWRDISALNDAQAAELIRADEIDILFDLSGHTSGNRLRVAAFRPATVQICGIGYMNSTGLDCFDYFLSDEICAGDENFFTETLIKLPRSHICYTPLETPPIIPAEKNFVAFGCFNNFGKVTDSILIAWKKILDAVPDSRLILKHKIFNTDNGRNFVGARLKICGIDLNQIEMRGFTRNYLRDYNDVDIALDTFPYVGGVTTCEALYMGVPVVSLYGKQHGTRFGLSILKNIGLEELAVDSLDDYVQRAIMLAGDKELCSLLKKNLRGMMRNSPLMNSRNYIAAVEKIFINLIGG